MKIIRKDQSDIYTQQVTATMSVAELMFIRGLAAAEADELAAHGHLGAAAGRLSKNSGYYWQLGLDYSKLFVENEE